MAEGDGAIFYVGCNFAESVTLLVLMMGPKVFRVAIHAFSTNYIDI